MLNALVACTVLITYPKQIEQFQKENYKRKSLLRFCYTIFLSYISVTCNVTFTLLLICHKSFSYRN